MNKHSIRTRPLPLLATAVLLVMILAPQPPAWAQGGLSVEYVVRIFPTLTDYYYGRASEEHFFTVSLEPEGEGYRVTSVSFSGMGASVFRLPSLVGALSFPGEWHFALPPGVLREAVEGGETSYNGARVLYVSHDAVTFAGGRMEDGVVVILSTQEGGKRVLYDDETGIMLREYFIVRGSLGQRSVVITQVHSSPGIIGDEEISRASILVFQAASALITLMALGVFALRERYRVL